DRTPTITVRGDIAEGLQPPDVSTAVWKELQPIIAKLPAGYRIEQGGSIEESGKANRAIAPLFPIMIALTLITIIFQVRSISVMTMVFATAPLGLIGVIPTLLLFQRCGCEHHRHHGDRTHLKDDRDQREGDHDWEQRSYGAICLPGLLYGTALLDSVARRQLRDDGLELLPHGGGHVRRLQALGNVAAHGDRRRAI